MKKNKKESKKAFPPEPKEGFPLMDIDCCLYVKWEWDPDEVCWECRWCRAIQKETGFIRP